MRVKLRLYITGRTGNSLRAIEHTQALRTARPGCEFDIEEIDVLEHPQRAEEDRILATPTLLKGQPAPTRRIVGDLSDIKRVLVALDLGESDGFAQVMSLLSPNGGTGR